MGADQVGYILIYREKEDAEKKVREHLAEVRDKIVLTLAGAGVKVVEDVPDDDLEKLVESLVEEHGLLLDENQFPDLEELARFLDELLVDTAPGNFEDAVEELSSPPLEARDVAARHMDDHVIIFAGEMTWGDEPDGYGYKWAKRSLILRTAELAGVE